MQREPFFQDAELLFQEIDSGRVVGHVTATTLMPILYEDAPLPYLSIRKKNEPQSPQRTQRKKKLKGFGAAAQRNGITDIFYISRRHTRSIDQARQAVS